MKKQNKKKSGWIMMSVLILFVCVAASTSALMGRMNSYLLDNSGAISLVSEEGFHAASNQQETDNGEAATSVEKTQQSEVVQKENPVLNADAPDDSKTDVISDSANETGSASNATQSGTSPSQPSSGSSSSQSQGNPDFVTSDEQGWWYTMTEVEIFKISYVNGEQEVVVNSDNGDKVIAPGAENSYTFKLENTGDVPLDYTVEVDAYFVPGDVPLPIECKLSRYDGLWVVGDQDSYDSVAALDAAYNEAGLGVGKYTYYTLDWVWPYDGGDDGYDTYLGDLATRQDLTFTIVIKTTATTSDNPNEDSGIIPPKTGDDSNPILWIILAIGSFLVMLFFIFYKDKDEEQSGAEAAKN